MRNSTILAGSTKQAFVGFSFTLKKRMKTKFVMKSKIAKKQTGKRDNLKSLEITLTIKGVDLKEVVLTFTKRKIIGRKNSINK